MSTAAMTYTEREALRAARGQALRALDSAGRAFLAPAWDGPLSALDANELTERADAIGEHIGRCTSRYLVVEDRFEVTIDVSPEWLEEIRRWATARVELLNEHHRRAAAAGVEPLDLVFASSSWELSRSMDPR